jgi:hypothetical protein
MPSIQVQRTLPNASPAIWQALADFHTIDRFHPMVDRVDALGQTTAGPGAARRCHFSNGQYAEEHLSAWNEGEWLEIDITRSSMPLKHAVIHISVCDQGAGASRVEVAMDFTPSLGPLGWVMGVIMMKPMMRRMLEQVLEGLEEHLRPPSS